MASDGLAARYGRYLLRNLKERFAFTLVVAISGVLTGLFTGSSVIVITVAVIAGLLFVAFVRTPESDEPAMPGSTRKRGAPFAWKLTVDSEIRLSTAIDRLEAIGLRLDARGASDAQLSAGSQLKTRLLGGYFVDPVHLPVVVTLKALRQGTGPIEASVRDGLGPIGVRDRKLEARYARRVAQIRSALDQQAQVGQAGFAPATDGL
jgi:hypothetical protein